MADNVVANAGSGGSTFAAPELSFSGDTVKLPIGAMGTLSGSEGAWTFTLYTGGAGAVTAGTQRITLASDDPAVSALGATGDAAATQGSTGSISAKLRTVTSQLNTGNASLSSIDGKITACNTGAVVVSSSALPSGASTAAKQPALGTAGTASADVLTVQGIASMTALKVDGSAVTQPVSGTLTAVTSITNPVAVTDNSGSLTVDNAGTFAVQATVAAGATNIAKAEDVASADADVGVPALAVRKATPANTSGTDGDYEFLQMSAGRLWTSAVIDTALPAGTNAIGKLASNTGVTIGAVEIAAAQTLATVTTVTTCSTVTTLTGGGVAHDGVDSGNPHKIGAKATTSVAGVTLVANADRTDLYAGSDGMLLVRTQCSLEDVVQERTTNTDGASTAFASGLAAPGAGVRLWITNVTIANSSSSFCTVDLRDGSGGSVLWTVPVPATGGAVVRFDPPLKLSVNTALAFDASAATSTLSISANGFKSKV